MRRAASAPLQDADVRAHALHILPSLRSQSHKCAVMMRITARVCAAPASSRAVRSNSSLTVFVWTNALAHTSDKSAHNPRNHPPKTPPRPRPKGARKVNATTRVS